MAKNSCVEGAWCTEDHDAMHTSPDFHIRQDQRDPGVGVLRHDLVFDKGSASIDIHEAIDWAIPLVQVPAFVQDMRAELDRVEAAAVKFMAITNPLVRTTEPGEPDLAGRGGGL